MQSNSLKTSVDGLFEKQLVDTRRAFLDTSFKNYRKESRSRSHAFFPWKFVRVHKMCQVVIPFHAQKRYNRFCVWNIRVKQLDLTLRGTNVCLMSFNSLDQQQLQKSFFCCFLCFLYAQEPFEFNQNGQMFTPIFNWS